jgi:hypothetical protein
MGFQRVKVAKKCHLSEGQLLPSKSDNLKPLWVVEGKSPQGLALDLKKGTAKFAVPLKCT